MCTIRALVLTAFLLFTIDASPLSAQAPLRIAYPVYPPFHWVKDNGEMAGFFYDIISEALGKRMGIVLVWTAYPWQRCQENVKNGRDDALLTVPTEARAAFTVTHKDPFYEKPLHLFTYRNHPRLAEIKRTRQIAGLRDGGFSVITYSGNGWHKENVEPLGIRTHETSHLENQWKMLAEQRGDLVIEWPVAAWLDIERVGLSDKIMDTGTAIAAMPFHLLIRTEAPQSRMLFHIDKTFRKMKADGAMKRILSKYY